MNENNLFLPEMTVQAMRDSRYRHPANAIAELIDNSIDADSTRIDLLIRERQVRATTRNVWRVHELAVLDNGHGMSPSTLVQALRFGGRGEQGPVHRIGKYGMGLPTSSVSQCKRLDVWTWESDINNAAHSFIDVDEIERGKQTAIPGPDFGPPPADWLDLASPDTRNHRRGTLVVWSKPDRIRQRAETIFNQVEEEIGRIYRHFIDGGDVNIRMATFRLTSQGQLRLDSINIDKDVRPNDPLYLMAESAVPREDGIPDPMFTEFSNKTFKVLMRGREEYVHVTYSIAKQGVLGEYKGDLPGNREYGKHARRNMGVSIVRENREISLENFFVREGGGNSIPQNRWWGCEVTFSAGLDDLFGVDHNKQQVANFSSAMKYFDGRDDDTRQLILDMEGDEYGVIYEVVGDIRNTTRAMMREIDAMFKRRPMRTRAGGGSTPSTPEGKAEEIVEEATRDGLQRGIIPQNQTDRDRTEKAAEVRVSELKATYKVDGLGEEEAQRQAEHAVNLGKWYSIIPAQLDGFQMFSFVSSGGTLVMRLNIRHPVYQFIQSIEDGSSESEVMERTAVGILAMLLSWGRLEEDIERDDLRMEVQDHARSWGRMVSHVLAQINVEGEEGQ